MMMLTTTTNNTNNDNPDAAPRIIDHSEIQNKRILQQTVRSLEKLVSETVFNPPPATSKGRRKTAATTNANNNNKNNNQRVATIGRRRQRQDENNGSDNDDEEDAQENYYSVANVASRWVDEVESKLNEISPSFVAAMKNVPVTLRNNRKCDLQHLQLFRKEFEELKCKLSDEKKNPNDEDETIPVPPKEKLKIDMKERVASLLYNEGLLAWILVRLPSAAKSPSTYVLSLNSFLSLVWMDDGLPSIAYKNTRMITLFRERRNLFNRLILQPQLSTMFRLVVEVWLRSSDLGEEESSLEDLETFVAEKRYDHDEVSHSETFAAALGYFLSKSAPTDRNTKFMSKVISQFDIDLMSQDKLLTAIYNFCFSASSPSSSSIEIKISSMNFYYCQLPTSKESYLSGLRGFEFLNAMLNEEETEITSEFVQQAVNVLTDLFKVDCTNLENKEVCKQVCSKIGNLIIDKDTCTLVIDDWEARSLLEASSNEETVPSPLHQLLSAPITSLLDESRPVESLKKEFNLLVDLVVGCDGAPSTIPLSNEILRVMNLPGFITAELDVQVIAWLMKGLERLGLSIRRSDSFHQAHNLIVLFVTKLMEMFVNDSSHLNHVLKVIKSLSGYARVNDYCVSGHYETPLREEILRSNSFARALVDAAQQQRLGASCRNLIEDILRDGFNHERVPFLASKVSFLTPSQAQLAAISSESELINFLISVSDDHVVGTVSLLARNFMPTVPSTSRMNMINSYLSLMMITEKCEALISTDEGITSACKFFLSNQTKSVFKSDFLPATRQLVINTVLLSLLPRTSNAESSCNVFGVIKHVGTTSVNGCGACGLILEKLETFGHLDDAPDRLVPRGCYILTTMYKDCIESRRFLSSPETILKLAGIYHNVSRHEERTSQVSKLVVRICESNQQLRHLMMSGIFGNSRVYDNHMARNYNSE